MSHDYETLSVEIDRGVLFATINNPPVNVMTAPLYLDLVGFTAEVEADDDVRVVVMQSTDPDFFIAHFEPRLPDRLLPRRGDCAGQAVRQQRGTGPAGRPARGRPTSSSRLCAPKLRKNG